MPATPPPAPWSGDFWGLHERHVCVRGCGVVLEQGRVVCTSRHRGKNTAAHLGSGSGALEAGDDDGGGDALDGAYNIKQRDGAALLFMKKQE